MSFLIFVISKISRPSLVRVKEATGELMIVVPHFSQFYVSFIQVRLAPLYWGLKITMCDITLRGSFNVNWFDDSCFVTHQIQAGAVGQFNHGRTSGRSGAVLLEFCFINSQMNIYACTQRYAFYRWPSFKWRPAECECFGRTCSVFMPCFLCLYLISVVLRCFPSRLTRCAVEISGLIHGLRI